MKVAIASLAVVAGAAVAQADMLYSTNFNAPTYANGNLVGQDGWAQTGATVTNPLQVVNTGTNGSVTVAATGQDANHGYLAQTTGSVYMSADLTVSSIAAGQFDYLLHLGDGGGSNFNARIYVRQGSSPNFFQLAMSTGSGAAIGTLLWGGDLALGTTINIMARYDMNAGAANDAGQLFVNPADAYGIGDTAYTNALLTGTDAATLSSVNIRQGATAAGLTGSIDNLSVYTIPTPGAAALFGAGILAAARRRRA